MSTEKTNKKKKTEEQSDDELLATLLKEQQSWYSFFTDALERAYNMMTFLYVSQWDSDVSNARRANQKPTMTYNMLVAIVNAILGEARKMSPENKVVGVGEDQDPKAADLRTDILRHISYECDGPTVFQNALKGMIEIGWGGAKVDICYRKGSFEKYIELDADPDYQSYYWDCAAQKADRSDGDFCGEHWTMAQEDYDRRYPDKPNPVSVLNNLYTSYESRDVVIGCNTWKKEYFPVTLCKLSDGTECSKKEAQDLIDARDAQIEAALAAFQEAEKELKRAIKKGEVIEPVFMTEEIPEPLEIVATREELSYKIMKYRWVQNYILEREEWPIDELAIVHFNGNSTVIRGERIPLSFIQWGVDPQKLINYYGSEVALSVLNSRRENWLATPAMIEGHEKVWNNAQNVQGWMPYNPDPMATGSGGKPEYIQPQVFNEGLLNAMQASIVQLKQVLGRPDETQGLESNAIAGVAIGKRQHAANNQVEVYIDNWQKGIQQLGIISLKLLPHIFDGEQSVKIRQADGATKSITVNRPTGRFMYGQNGEPAEEIIENDLSEGDYDLEVQVSGSYDMQQLEKMNAFKEFLGMVAQVDPAKPSTIIDLTPKMFGLENAVEIQNRFIATSPPQLKAIIEGKDPSTVPLPPPTPEMMIAQQKDALAHAEMQLRREELQLEAQVKLEQAKVDLAKTENARLEMLINAQIAGVNAEAAAQKAKADVVSTHIRSRSEIEKATINQRTEHLKQGTEHMKHATQRMGHIAKMQQQVNKKKTKPEKNLGE